MTSRPPAAPDLRALYQPIVDLRSGRVVAAEGLIRGARGSTSVSPAELFAEAGREGPAAVLRLDEACLRCVIGSASALGADATLFVNVEPATLAVLSRRTVAELAARLPPGVQVVVEVTERGLLSQPAQLLAGVQRVRELGWRIAVDDVGAEPSALALMPFLRPDVIKLDLALVRARPTLNVAAIVNAVNAAAQRSGALVLAEGIETAEHLRRALSLGATLGQGWHFAHPGPLAQHRGSALRLPPAPEPPPVAVSPFELISRSVPAQPTTPALLAPLTRQVERQAMLLDDMSVVLACFQHVRFVTPSTLRRYESLGMTTALTVIFAPGVRPEPVPGVLGTALHESDPLAQEWVVTVVSPHFAAALAARDVSASAGAGQDDPVVGPGTATQPAGAHPGGQPRRMEYVLTYDRDQVVAAATLLMAKVQARTPTSRRPGPRTAQGPVPAPGAPVHAGRHPGGDSPAEARTEAPGGATVLHGVPKAELPALLTRAISTASNGIVIADARAHDMPLVYVNAAFEQMTGYTQEEVLGRNCRLLQGPATDPTLTRVIGSRLIAGRDAHVTLLNYRRDGTTFWNEITISPVSDAHGHVTHFIGNQVDVSDRVDREERTTYLAYHDPLTGLPNRANVLETLDRELRRSARSGAGVAVVFIDLDRFKEINDAFGHAVGDQTLIEAAHRLGSVVRSGDMLARLSGDEFLLVLTDLPAGRSDSVRRVVEHLHAALHPAVEIAGSSLTLTAGIGFAFSPDDGTDAAALIDIADARMYQAKRAT
ncbi:diguanylate cyclase domain-containing protein [Cellulomonas aerilata]|uniref:diguanylate cyclase domain-containing protein n=1 Tax=Cellulomonas aerilata TaxID=515326 RepID=UPI001649D534|nr:diguanylate cyclase [Cellulomonas aerilata]